MIEIKYLRLKMTGNVMDLGHGIDNRDEKASINWSEYDVQESELTN